MATEHVCLSVGDEMPFMPTKAALISQSDRGRGCDVWRRRASYACGWTEETGQLLSTDQRVLLRCNGSEGAGISIPSDVPKRWKSTFTQKLAHER